MIEIRISTRFRESHKKFIKNNRNNTKSTSTTLGRLALDPQYPSLHLEKLKNSNYWTVRVDRSNRIFFIWIDKNTVLLVDIGPHDKYRRY